jgi:transposase
MAIDLLPDRSVETVAAWFVAHPSIELISRDGSSEHAAAALKGAPQAIQVSDKWHLVKNLAKALQVLLTHHFTVQRKQKTQAVGKQKESACSPDRESRLSPQQARIQNVYREDRLARSEQVIAPLQARHVAGTDRAERGRGPQHRLPMAAGSYFSRAQATRTSQPA